MELMASVGTVQGKCYEGSHSVPDFETVIYMGIEVALYHT